MTDPIRGRRRDDRLWVRWSALLLATAGLLYGVLWFVDRASVEAGAASINAQLPGTLGTIWSLMYLLGGVAVIGGYLRRNVETEALGLWILATAILVNAGAIVSNRAIAALPTAPALLACVAVLMARVEYLRTLAGRPPKADGAGIDPTRLLAFLPLPLAAISDYGPIAALILGAGGVAGSREWLLIRAERRSKDSNSFVSLTAGQHTVIADLRTELDRKRAALAEAEVLADAQRARADRLEDALTLCREHYRAATGRAEA